MAAGEVTKADGGSVSAVAAAVEIFESRHERSAELHL